MSEVPLWCRVAKRLGGAEGLREAGSFREREGLKEALGR